MKRWGYDLTVGFFSGRNELRISFKKVNGGVGGVWVWVWGREKWASRHDRANDTETKLGHDSKYVRTPPPKKATPFVKKKYVRYKLCL